MNCDKPLCRHTVTLLGAGWFLLALFVGETQALSLLPPFAPQLIIVGLSVAILASYFLIGPFRAAIDSWSIRALVGIHVARFVGVYFLILSAHGRLDPRFAIPAGWGDIIVATGAAVLLFVKTPRLVLHSWNVLGFVDILFVIVRAATVRASDRYALSELTRLPLSFLPTVLVPIIVASHVVLFLRLRRKIIAPKVPTPASPIVAV